MSLPWFRMYAEFATDPAVQCLAFDDQRHYVVALCLKCSGVLDKDYPSEQQRQQVLRRAFGLDTQALAEAKRRLLDAGLIDENWQPLAWEKRQFVSDSSTDRVRKHRKRKGKTKKKMKRRCNVSETAASVSVSVSESTEGEREGEPPPQGLDLPSWERWADYRKAIRKPIKPVSVPAAQRKLAGFGSDQSEVVEQSIANGWQGLFALKDGPRQGSDDFEDPYITNLRRAGGARH